MTHLICDKLVGVVYFHCAVNDPVCRTGLEIANLQNDHLEEQRAEEIYSSNEINKTVRTSIWKLRTTSDLERLVMWVSSSSARDI